MKGNSSIAQVVIKLVGSKRTDGRISYELFVTEIVLTFSTMIGLFTSVDLIIKDT